MSIVEPGSAGSNLFERAKNILTRPSETWDAIDSEPASVGGLYAGYVIPLALIPVVCSIIGQIVFGFGAFGVTVHLSPVFVIVNALVGFALNLAMIFILSLVIDGLAHNFGAERSQVQAMKLAAYAPTASWVAGVFALYPPLAVIGLLGVVYSFYLLWLGLPKLMKAPELRAGPYYLAVLVVTLVVGIVVAVASSAVSWPLRTALGGSPISSAHVSGKVKVPGVGSVDVGQIEEAARQLEAAKDVAATDPTALQAYLPAAVAGFSRTEVSSTTGGAAGVEGSAAEGKYEKGDARLELSVVDMGGAGALLGMAGSFKASKETATGYERMGKVDGRMTQEKYDRTTRSGEYSVVIGERFMVHAEGDGVSMDELKAAVAAVPAARLEGLAKAG